MFTWFALVRRITVCERQSCGKVESGNATQYYETGSCESISASRFHIDAGRVSGKVWVARINVVVAAAVLICGALRPLPADAERYRFEIRPERLTGLSASDLNRPLGPADAIHAGNGHFYTVGRDLKPGTADDTRVRFWGINLAPPLTFPASRAQADRLASGLARLGFNLVRLHGLDQPGRSQDKTLLSLRGNAPYPELDSSNLAALDRLFDSMERHGIYIDLGLKVAYRFDSGKDCFHDSTGNRKCVPDPEVVTQTYPVSAAMPAGSEPLDLFNREMRELQKRYFRALVERYGNRPGLALVEINNENSLIETYVTGKDDFPPLYAQELDARWHRWLAERYPTPEKLVSAWGAGSGDGANLISNGEFAMGTAGKPSGWVVAEDVRVAVADAGRGILVRPETRKKTSDEMSIWQDGIPVRRGGMYKVSFNASGMDVRELGVALSAPAGPGKVMPVATPLVFRMSPSRQEFSACFYVTRNVSDTRIRFYAARQDSGFRIDRVSLVPYAAPAYPEVTVNGFEGAMVTNTAPRPATPARGDCDYSPAREKDYLLFLAEVEHEYYAEMASYLRNRLGLSRPLTGTQANFGGLFSLRNMADIMDFTDVHFYWDHPHISRTDGSDWWIENRPMVESPARGIAMALARGRVAGKPFTISEYSPNNTSSFSQDGYLLAAAYAAFQDIDAVVLFTYNAAGGSFVPPASPPRLRGWYTLAHESRALAQMHLAANLFRRGDVAPANSFLKFPVLPEGREGMEIRDASKRNIEAVVELPGRQAGAVRGGFSVLSGLLTGVELDLSGGHDAGYSLPAGQARPVSPFRSDTGELEWHVLDQEGSYFILDTALSKAVAGYLGRDFVFEGLKVSGAGDEHAYGMVSITSLDGLPVTASSSMLLSTIGAGRNRNTEYVQHGRGVTLCVTGRKGNCEKPFWHAGAGPFMLESNPVTVRIAGMGRALRVSRLDESGVPVSDVQTRRDGDEVEFNVGKDGDGTPWYWIRAIQ